MINLYESYHEALHAIQELEAAQIHPAAISLITLNGKAKSGTMFEDTANAQPRKPQQAAIAQMPDAPELTPNVKADFFSGLDLRELQGIGDVIAAGWLLEHRADGEMDVSRHPEDVLNLLDCMVVCGLTRDMAETYIEGIRRGATLLGVRVEAPLCETAERIMVHEHQPLDPHMRGKHYWVGESATAREKETSAVNRLLSLLIAGLS